MSDGFDLVKTIKISATNENVDATKASTEKLSAAVTQLTDANQKNTNTLRDAITTHDSYADKLLKLGTVMAVVYGAWTLATSVIKSYVDMIKTVIEIEVARSGHNVGFGKKVSIANSRGTCGSDLSSNRSIGTLFDEVHFPDASGPVPP